MIWLKIAFGIALGALALLALALVLVVWLIGTIGGTYEDQEWDGF